MLKRYAGLAALVLAFSAGAARADWLFTPQMGTTFGADASGNEHLTYGASIGWMGAGAFGWEADLSYTPQFFDTGDPAFALTSSDSRRPLADISSTTRSHGSMPLSHQANSRK